MRRCLLIGLLGLLFMPMDTVAQAIPSSLTAYTLRLRPGQDLKQSIDSWLTAGQIEAGAVLTCVGSLTNVSLRLANQDGPTRYSGHFEIVSLVGTLSVNGSHLHLSVSDSTGPYHRRASAGRKPHLHHCRTRHRRPARGPFRPRT